MTNRVGLWIDHKRAVIVSVEPQGTIIRKVDSGARRVEYRGGQRSKAAYSAQYSQGDDQLDNQFTEQLNKYYAQVAALLRGATNILIFGPGEAKTELNTRLAREKGAPRQRRVEPSDKMTDRQIAARVRAYFETERGGA
jgi:50S ribosomal subunit-associated GTPase HflX